MLAQILLIRGDEDGAERRMRLLAEAAAGHPGMHFLRGRFHAQRGRYERAAADLALAADALGGGVDATISLQQAYVEEKLGHPPQAAALLAAAEADLRSSQRDGG